MAKSTAPVLIAGGIAFTNHWLVTKQIDIRAVVATGIAAMGLALAEQIPGAAPLAAGIAWIAVVTVLFSDVTGSPSPVENIGKATGLMK